MMEKNTNGAKGGDSTSKQEQNAGIEILKKIKYLEHFSWKELEGNCFEDYLSDIHRAFKFELEKKFPELKKYSYVAKTEFTPQELELLKKHVVEDSERVSGALQEFVHQNKEMIVQCGIDTEYINFIENIRAFLQILVNYFSVEDKTEYEEKLKEAGFDIKSIFSLIYERMIKK